MSSLSILIADDHEVVRRGIRTLIEARTTWKICGEAATGRDAIEKARKFRPDVVVLDVTMPEMDGLQAIPQILCVCPGTKILVLTMHDSGEMAAQVLGAGASGMVLKSETGHELVQAIRTIRENQLYLSPAVTKIIIGQLANTGKPEHARADISPRELEILKLLALGRSSKEAASTLHISVKTVDAHRSSIMRKLDLRTTSDLIHFAIRHKIIEV